VPHSLVKTVAVETDQRVALDVGVTEHPERLVIFGSGHDHSPSLVSGWHVDPRAHLMPLRFQQAQRPDQFCRALLLAGLDLDDDVAVDDAHQ
jgi:hypothetical protein